MGSSSDLCALARPSVQVRQVPALDPEDPQHRVLVEADKPVHGAAAVGRLLLDHRLDRLGVCLSLYRLRNLVERWFKKLETDRCIASRYDKTAESFLSLIERTSIRLWTRHLPT